MPFDKLVAGNSFKSGVPQYQLVMRWAAARLWLLRTAAAWPNAARPSSDDVGDKALPRFLALHHPVASQVGQTAPWLQPLQRLFGHELLIEAVKRFPDGDQLACGWRCVQRFGLPNHPCDIGHAALCCLFLPDRDHLGFEIDRPYLAKRRNKREGDTPRAAGEVEQPALTRDTSPFDEVSQQCLGIGNAIAQIVGGCTSKGIARKVRLDVRNARCPSCCSGPSALSARVLGVGCWAGGVAKPNTQHPTPKTLLGNALGSSAWTTRRVFGALGQ